MSSSQGDSTTDSPKHHRVLSALDGETVLPLASSDELHHVGEIIDNRYVIISEIGRGGMGVVYEVRDTLTTHRYAVKRLLPSLSQNAQLIDAFIREGTEAEKFSASSRHLVTTKLLGKDSKGCYVLMELVKFPTLKQVLSTKKRTEPKQAMVLLHGLATAIADLHRSGHVHRDLKPANIFVDVNECPPVVKLGDFGLTHAFTSWASDSPDGAGTYKYMAPEQFRNEPTSLASDVYAFGVIAFELLTGEYPHFGENLSDYVPNLPHKVVDLVVHCLSARVESRISDGESLLQRVTQILSEMPSIGNMNDESTNISFSPPVKHTWQGIADADLKMRTVLLTLNEVPVGAQIYLNGNLVDGLKHRLEISRERNYCDLHITCEDHIDFSQKVTFDSGESMHLSVNMIRLSRPQQRRKRKVSPLDEYLESMCFIPAGKYLMGSSENDREKPPHIVNLSPFHLGRTPVTVEVWREFCMSSGKSMPIAPPWGWIDDHPMVNISWADIMGSDGTGGFCGWVSERVGYDVVLPTEAQWELACRDSKDNQDYPWGNKFIDDCTWCSVVSKRQCTASVRRTENIYVTSLGLSDLIGNVWEWCYDWYEDGYTVSRRKKGRPTHAEANTVVTMQHDLINPSGPDHGEFRCLRGGSWSLNSPDGLRAAYRNREYPRSKSPNDGFRLSTPVISM
jgi:serine/threonine protein kinase